MRISVLMFFFIVSISCSKKQDKIRPELRDITESVYSSVTIQPDSLYNVYANVGGILDKNLVTEGDLVTKGDPLMQIINSTPELNTQNAGLSLELAKENYTGSATILASIQDEINAAWLKLKNDSINFFRQKTLWEQSIGSKVEYDTKLLNYKLAQNNLKLLKGRYNNTKHELETTVKQANNNYQTALINTKDFTVKSKIKGKVYALYNEPGEIVSTMQSLALIGSESNFVVELLVDEVDIVKISKDQKVIITLDAYNGDIFTGRISKIYPKKDERNQTFKLEALFDVSPEIVYPGLSGEANIIISKKENVLTIPKSYVIHSDKVKTENGLVTITKGLENLEYVEILSGITEATYIYKPNNA
ncbi:HlyD family efflux transporter periplasmic adaptor subunit [Lacinutrix neustonica]|uniref:HlyD family efflux transporter periplasmic adaptor subunit n=1 Tax=Lacinutrix neustonica TaxID=2980107 RepID=A0A9E8MXN0_9FLAO|nr:HlyD family efflux transporter periplasmic adaptor subunit [Lacinutrix neustonica]WAC02785.1 HlyD family efflux transporter periplasmic adaptor subunit [Lacinutrix neustonica]